MQRLFTNQISSLISLPVDYSAMKTSREKLFKALKGAERVRITTALGTNIEIRFGKERKWFDDVTFDSSPAINIPNGEVYCGPLEDGANGRIVVDGSMGDFGLAPTPLVIEVKNGRIVEKDGELVGVRWLNPKFKDQTDFLSRIKEELKFDAMAYLIGEFGIGLAPYPLIGELLQDEKAARTIHIAFGNNETEGGTNKSDKHIDFLVKNPTVEVYYPEAAKQPSRVIMVDGNLTL